MDSPEHGYPKPKDAEDRTPTNLTGVEWRRRILVVKDELLIASLMADSLIKEGFEAATAGNAVEARRQPNARATARPAIWV